MQKAFHGKCGQQRNIALKLDEVFLKKGLRVAKSDKTLLAIVANQQASFAGKETPLTKCLQNRSKVIIAELLTR